MPKKSEKSAATTEKVALPRDLQLKWDDVQIEMKKAQVSAANATKKIDEFALEILQRKYANCGTQTEASMTIRVRDLPERLRNADVAELLRELKVLNDLHAVHDEVASGDFGSTIRRKLKELATSEVKTEKKADARTKKEDDQQMTKEGAKVGTTGDDGIEVPIFKHEDRDSDVHRSHHEDREREIYRSHHEDRDHDARRSRYEDRAVSEDRRSLPRPGRTPPRLPRGRVLSKSPERDPQWKADLITSRIQQARKGQRTPSHEAREDGQVARNPRRDERSRSRGSDLGEQRHKESPATDGRRHRRPTPVDEHQRWHDGGTVPRRPPVSPIPDAQRRRHPPPSPTDGNATKDAKPKDEEPRADEEAVLESGDDEAPPVLEKCAQAEEAKPEEGEIDEEEDKGSMPVVAPSKKSAADNPLEAGRTHRKRTAPGRPKAPKKKKAKSVEVVEDSSDTDAEAEEKKRKEKRKKKSKTAEGPMAKTEGKQKDDEEAERQPPHHPSDGNEGKKTISEGKKNDPIEEKKDEPKEVPGIIYPDARSRSQSRSPSRSRSPPKEKPEHDAQKADSDASSSSSSSSSSESNSSSSSAEESEGEVE